MNTKATQARGIQFWSKEILSRLFVQEADTIAEIYSDKGSNLGKWERSKVKQYYCIDVSEKSIKETKKRWQERGEKFQAQFIQQDPTKSIDLKDINSFVCFHRMSDNFKSVNSTKSFLSNVHSSLKKGGYFFGMMFDSSAIWIKTQQYGTENTENKTIEIEKKLFKLSLPSDFERIKPYFGFKLNLKVSGEVSDADEYFVHSQSFLRISKEIGFDVIAITNLYPFYEDHKYIFEDILKDFKIFKDQNKVIDPSQKEIIELYCIFVLKKI